MLMNKQCWCQHSSTAIWCRRLTEMLFSILLNWPLGLIIPLDGFRCHTVWEVGGWRGTGQGQRLRGVEGVLTPRCAISMLVSLWPQGQSHWRAKAFPHLDLCSLFFFLLLLLLCKSLNVLLQPTLSWEPPNTTTVVHWWPMNNLTGKTKGSVRHGHKQNPSVCFCMTLRQWLFQIFNWKGDMAPHGNPSVQNWYLSDSCPLISIDEQAWDFQALFHLFQVIEMWSTLAGR